MTDDDKKAADTYAMQRFGVSCYTYSNGDCEPHPAIETFLDGIAHARKPHVVAEGDLPRPDQWVLVLTSDGVFKAVYYTLATLKFHGPLVDDQSCRGTFEPWGELPKYEIKYWWPLPEIKE